MCLQSIWFWRPEGLGFRSPTRLGEIETTLKSEVTVAPFCDPMDCSPPGFSVHGILQARILEWVAISFSITLKGHTISHSMGPRAKALTWKEPGQTYQLVLESPGDWRGTTVAPLETEISGSHSWELLLPCGCWCCWVPELWIPSSSSLSPRSGPTQQPLGTTAGAQAKELTRRGHSPSSQHTAV